MKPIKSPTRLERQREIDAILDKADLKERRFIPLMLKMLKDVGPIHCFLGVKWAPALCVLVGLFCWGLVSQKTAADYSVNLNYCLRVTIFIQPLLLTGISMIACIIEKYMSVWEMRAVCRYNDKYLLAFRMLMMGVVGMFSVGLTLLSIQWAEGAMLLKIFLVSSASYFLCGCGAYGGAAASAGKMVLAGAGFLVWAGIIPADQKLLVGYDKLDEQSSSADTADNRTGNRSLLFLADKAVGFIKN